MVMLSRDLEYTITGDWFICNQCGEGTHILSDTMEHHEWCTHVNGSGAQPSWQRR